MRSKQLLNTGVMIFAGILGHQAALSADGPKAAIVTANDTDCITDGSTVKYLTIDEAGVNLEVDGSCVDRGGSTDTPSGLVNITTPAIDEGRSTTVELGTNVVVTLPFAATISTPPSMGTASIIGDTSAFYTAPRPGTVPVTGGQDTFNYSFSDATGNTETRTVTVPLNWVDPGSSTGECVENLPALKCMGELPEWPGGTLLNQRLDPGQTQVWYFDYSAVENDDGTFMLLDGNLKIVSVSLSSNDFSLKFPCKITQEVPQQPLFYAPAGIETWQQCGFENGKRYYLNIRSTISGPDPFTLIVR